MVPRLPVVGVLIFVCFQISASQIGAEISEDPDPCAPDAPSDDPDPCAPSTSLSPAGKNAGIAIGAITGAAAVGAAGWGIMEGVQNGQIATLAPAESSMSSQSFAGSDMSSAGAPMSSAGAPMSSAGAPMSSTAAAAAAASPGALPAAALGAPAPSVATPEDNVSSGMTRTQMWLGAGLLALLCCCACLAVALAFMFCKPKKTRAAELIRVDPEAQPLVGPYMVNAYPPMTVGPAVPVGEMVHPIQTAMPVMPVPTVPMATVGVDTRYDGRANHVMSGVDMNRDGIRNVLQGPVGSPLGSPLGPPRMWG